MVINFNPKYIPGDIVYNHKKEIIRITSSYLKGTKLFYYRDGNYGWIREDAIKPIPLTPEILEKNGWEHKDDIYFKEFPHRKLVIMDENAYIINECCSMFLCPAKFVPQLQHLLFGLGINHEMEV